MKRGKASIISGLLALSLAGCAPLIASHEQEVERREVVTAHGTLHLAVKEEGQGRPILLLHGFGTSGYSWRKIVPALARDHRVITLDLRGFGASDKPLDEHYSIADQAEAVEAFIKQEDLKDLTVVGHSFGGGVTLALALKLGKERPARIHDLVLLDTIAYRQPLPVFFRLLQYPAVAQVSMTLIPPEVQATEALRLAYYERDKITARDIMEYASPLYSPAGKRALIATVNKLIPDDIDEIAERYKTLKLPTQIIWCDADRIVPLALGRRLNENIPSAQLTVLSDCGHFPHEEKPEETVAVIRAFIARQDG